MGKADVATDVEDTDLDRPHFLLNHAENLLNLFLYTGIDACSHHYDGFFFTLTGGSWVFRIM